MADWYYQVMGGVMGPASAAEMKRAVKEGAISFETPVRKGADGKWVKAQQVKGLFDDANSEPAAGTQSQHVPTDPTPPRPQSMSDKSEPLRAYRPSSRGKMIALVGAGALAATAVVVLVVVFRGGGDDTPVAGVLPDQQHDLSQRALPPPNASAQLPSRLETEKSERTEDTTAQVQPPKDPQQPVKQQAIPPKVKAYWGEMKAAQREAIANYEKDIAETQDDLAFITDTIAKLDKEPYDPNSSFPIPLKRYAFRLRDLRYKQNSLRKQHTELQRSLDALRKYPRHVRLGPDRNSLGKLGVLHSNVGRVQIKIRVEQVTGRDEMLVRQVAFLDDEIQGAGNVLLVRKVSTKGLVDNSYIQLPQVFEVTDTKTYETVNGGTNTVFVVEPIAIEAYLNECFQHENPTRVPRTIERGPKR